MRLIIIAGLVFTLVSCKTAGSNSDLSQARPVAEQEPNLQDMLGDYEFVGGQYIVNDLWDRPRDRREIKSEPSRTGTLALAADGTYTLAANFAAAASSGAGKFGPGVMVAINPGAKPKIEQYVVSNQGWVGDSVNVEMKIETVDSFKAGDSSVPATLVETVTMSDRRYKWFYKDEWKQFKTITNKISLAKGSLTFTSYVVDNMWKETVELNFKRK